MFYATLSQRRANKFSKLLNDCRAEEYVEAYDRLEEKAYKGEGKRSAVMNKARGLISMGAIDEALEILRDLELSEKHKVKDMHMMAVYNNLLFNAYVEKGDLESAVKSLAVCDYMLTDIVYQEPYRSMMYELCQRANARLALARGEFDGIEDRYWEFLRTSSSKIDKVMCHYRLAEIAEHFGNEEERQEHLEFVSENGGSTIYKFLADLALDGASVQDQAYNEGFVDG